MPQLCQPPAWTLPAHPSTSPVPFLPTHLTPPVPGQLLPEPSWHLFLNAYPSLIPPPWEHRASQGLRPWSLALEPSELHRTGVSMESPGPSRPQSHSAPWEGQPRTGQAHSSTHSPLKLGYHPQLEATRPGSGVPASEASGEQDSGSTRPALCRGPLLSLRPFTVGPPQAHHVCGVSRPRLSLGTNAADLQPPARAQPQLGQRLPGTCESASCSACMAMPQHACRNAAGRGAPAGLAPRSLIRQQPRARRPPQAEAWPPRTMRSVAGLGPAAPGTRSSPPACAPRKSALCGALTPATRGSTAGWAPVDGGCRQRGLG